MSDLEEATILLQAAHRDLQALTGMLNREVFADEIFGFHVQQAVEKSLKAWLTVLGDAYPYTHDLMSLMRRVEGLGGQVLTEFEPLLGFTLYAVQFRYGFVDTLDEPLNREEWIALANRFAGLPSGRITPLAVGMPHPAMGLGLALIGYGLRMRTWRLQRRLFRHRHLRPLQRLPLD